MALKEWAQLFDASPLMQNDLNSTENKGYDTERAKSAAKSAYEVIRYMDGSKSAPYPYGLASKEEYTNVFYFKYPPVHQPEYIWVKRQFPNAANQTKNALSAHSGNMRILHSVRDQMEIPCAAQV